VTTRWIKVSGPGKVTFADDGATETTAVFSEAGPYLLELVANDGAKQASADMTVLVSPATVERAILEAEAEEGRLKQPMEIRSATSASGGRYVIAPEGSGNNYNDATNGGPGEVAFSLNIPQGGRYALWARTIAPDFGSNAFYVTSGERLISAWNVPLSNGWKWTKIADLFLGAGTFSLTFRQREDGTSLDKVLITNDLNLVPR
jgi:hypothetical protein